MSNSAKIVVMIAGLLTLAILAVVVGIRETWDALLGLAICIDSNGMCPWD